MYDYGAAAYAAAYGMAAPAAYGMPISSSAAVQVRVCVCMRADV